MVVLLLNQYFLRDSQQMADQEVLKGNTAFQQNLSECSISGSNREQTIPRLEHHIGKPSKLPPGTPRSPIQPGLDLLNPKLISNPSGTRDFQIPSINLAQSDLSESIVVSVSGRTLGAIDSGKTSIVDSSHNIGGVTYHMLRNTRAQKFADISTERNPLFYNA